MLQNQPMATPTGQNRSAPEGGYQSSLEAVADGLLALTPEERHELDVVVTPRISALLTKAFGEQFYKVLKPLTVNDGPDGLPKGSEQSSNDAQPNHPEEEKLRQMMRDPRYWRDKDPSFLNKVSEGFQRLYG